MNRDEIARLLRTRSALTSQPYGDDAIDAWLEVLQDRTFTECRTALVDACKVEKRVTAAHIIERLHGLAGEEPVVDGPVCSTCAGTGVRSGRQMIGLATYDVVVACADCGRGRAAAGMLRRCDEANAKTNAGIRQEHGPVIVTSLGRVDDTEMSFDEYLGLITRRAKQGAAEAAEMLDIWAANIERGVVFPS